MGGWEEYLERHVMQDLLARAVPEAHVLKLDTAPARLTVQHKVLCIRGVYKFRLHIQEVEPTKDVKGHHSAGV